MKQRGEGKLGCIVSLVVLAALGGVAAKVVPVLFSNNELWDTALDTAGRASSLDKLTIQKQLEAKARELEIPEALQPGAIKVAKPEGTEGTCTVELHYTRTIDLYGITQVKIDTNKQKAIPYHRY